MKMRLIGWGLVGVLALGAGAVVINVVGTAASVATAPGRVIQRTMDTDNIISTYEWYHDAWGSLQAKTGTIKAHKDLIATEDNKPEVRRLRVELAGIQIICRNLVQEYNANSTKTNKSIFKGKTAPERIDSTHCE